MFGISMFYAEECKRQNERLREAQERWDRQIYDINMMRGPMEYADIDWRAPREKRPMVAGDL